MHRLSDRKFSGLRHHYCRGHITCRHAARYVTSHIEISRDLDAKRGIDSNVGLKLHCLLREAGFTSPEIRIRQTPVLRGEAKRFWEMTLREATPALIESGVTSADEIESVCAEMEDIARDETTPLLLALVTRI